LLQTTFYRRGENVVNMLNNLLVTKKQINRKPQGEFTKNLIRGDNVLSFWKKVIVFNEYHKIRDA